MGLEALTRAAAVGLPLLLFTGGGFAQEGFPLDGTWRGQWGQTDSRGANVVIVMKWTGDAIEGTLNPGPNSTAFANATLDPDTWTVHIEAAPEAGPVTIEGTLRDIGSYNRYIEGTWRQNGNDYAFRITRE